MDSDGFLEVPVKIEQEEVGEEEEVVEERRSEIIIPDPVFNNTVDTAAETVSPNVPGPSTPYGLFDTFSVVSVPALVWGPPKPFPRHLFSLLEEWHGPNPSTQPPFSYRVPNDPKRRWKVFNRDGDELGLSKFVVEQPVRYYLLVLHDPNGPEKIVACGMGSWYHTCFVAWRSVEHGYESQACAIRIYTKTAGENIVFVPHLFETAGANRMPYRVAQSTGAVVPRTLQTTPKTRVLAQKSSSHNPSSNSSRNEASSLFTVDDTGRSTGNTSDDDDDDAPQLPFRSKRQKTSNQGGSGQGGNEHVDATPQSAGDIIFKLISEYSGATRCFPSKECSSGKDLFRKAQEFFQLLEKGKVKALICQIPSQREQRYLFDGSEGEFNLLIDDFKLLKSTNNRTLTVEFKIVGA